ncbi:MAG: hypothetical protein AAGD00_03150 [Planctomycetota bacterium]
MIRQLSALSACALASSVFASNGAFNTYGNSVTSFTLPIESPSFFHTGDALPDGRLVTVTGSSVFLESSPGSRTFDVVATFDPSETPGADPSFVRVSPDGSNIAVGLGFGQDVAVFQTSALGTPGSPAALTSGTAATYFGVNHFDAEWASNSELAITFGNFGTPANVSLLDVTTGTNPTIISNLRGASAGIAFDDQGRLFTANGFDDGTGSATGDIRAFEETDWRAGGLNFETDGSFVANLLSGNGLTFDTFGNLAVGGGGAIGLVSAESLDDLFASADPVSGSDLRFIDPEGSGSAFYNVGSNPFTGEIYGITSDFFSESTWFATVPAPASILLFAAPLACARRRRVA